MSKKNLEPVTDRDGDEAVRAQVNDEAGYRVGYGCPPLETRFQKGKSGNPKGRPKGRTSNKPASLRATFTREAEKLLYLPEGTALPKMVALSKAIFAQALKGSPAAMKLAASLLGEGPMRGLSEKDVEDRVQQRLLEEQELRYAEEHKGAEEFTRMMLEMAEGSQKE